MADGCGREVDVLKMLFCVVYRYTYVWPTGVGWKLTCSGQSSVLITGYAWIGISKFSSPCHQNTASISGDEEESVKERRNKD